MELTRDKIIHLLKSENEEEIQELFARARQIREANFGRKIFMYGFVYFSTWCRNNCAFCYFRRQNDIERYRKKPEEILAISKSLAESGVHAIDLTMGEDSFYHGEEFETVLSMIREIKEATGLPVMISPGVVKDEVIQKFAQAGADWYALYQETHNRELFARLRLSQDYDERMHAKLFAKEQGMLIEEGLMSGIGESCEDMADSLLEMGRIGADQVRIMSFVPQEGSPMEHHKTPDRMMELKVIALMRILYPWTLIPTSLDVDGIQGLEARINAGGNVVTSIIPPRTGLAGVAQSSMDVDEGNRTVEEVVKILHTLGLKAADAKEYQDYLGELKCRKS